MLSLLRSTNLFMEYTPKILRYFLDCRFAPDFYYGFDTVGYFGAEKKLQLFGNS